MTVSRPIQATEADTFLTLLCNVFGLDAARARPIFYGEPYFELGRKWARFEGEEMISILTITPLDFGWGRAFGIAGVATHPDHRGQGHAAELIETALRVIGGGEPAPALLFAQNASLYARLGFEILDDVVRGHIVADPDLRGTILPFEEIRARYDRWADGSADRLRRDPMRWKHWSWTLRTCEGIGNGYVCHEGPQVREAIGMGGRSTWPVIEGTEWSGLTRLTEELGVPLLERKHVMYMMGRRIPGHPILFLTDQF